MSKPKLFIIIAVAVVIISLLTVAGLTYIPRTRALSYDMHGCIISPDGEILEQFTFKITGTVYDFIIDPPGGLISFSDNRLTALEEDALILQFEWNLDSINEICSFGHMIGQTNLNNPRYTIGSIDFYNQKLNQLDHEPAALIDLERGSFCMYAEHLADNAFIVGSTDPRTDPNALIKAYIHEFGNPANEKPRKIDWSMTGTMVSGSGEVLRSCNLSISGNLTLGKNGKDQLDLDIRFPKLFEYWYDGPATYTSQSRKYFITPYPVFPHYAYNRDTDDHTTFSVFAVCPEKEYVIFRWEDGKDQYLVASTDPNVSPQEILSYFETFTEKFVIRD